MIVPVSFEPNPSSINNITAKNLRRNPQEKARDVTEEDPRPRASHGESCENKNRDYKGLDRHQVQYRMLFVFKVTVWFEQIKCFLS